CGWCRATRRGSASPTAGASPTSSAPPSASAARPCATLCRRSATKPPSALPAWIPGHGRSSWKWLISCAWPTGWLRAREADEHPDLFCPEPVIPGVARDDTESDSCASAPALPHACAVVHAFTATPYTVAMDEAADYTLEIQIATRFLD